MEPVEIIDSRILDSIREYPGEELGRILFPDARWHGKRLMSSPFRSDSDPSFSYFRGRDGVSRWKDHGTDESGDNIDLFRKTFPGYDYVEAVDRLSWLVLGRSAKKDYVGTKPEFKSVQAKRKSISYNRVPVQHSALNILDDKPLCAQSAPKELVDYWRSRAVPDSVCENLGRLVRFENTNITLKKYSGGREVYDELGNNVTFHPYSDAIGLYNDIGGVNLRVPRTEKHKEFKGGTSSYISTILDDMTRPTPCVRFGGEGDARVLFFRYDEMLSRLYINPTQYFEGIDGGHLPLAFPFVHSWDNKVLDPMDVSKCCAVLSSLCCPVHKCVCVVEGMFDAFSKFGFQAYGNTSFKGDLVALNSVNNARWAVPFLSRHRYIYLLLDLDERSKTGQKTAERLSEEIGSYCYACGLDSKVFSLSEELFKGDCKDLNECLIKNYGNPEMLKKKVK